jgi:Radical SAM superfamily
MAMIRTLATVAPPSLRALVPRTIKRWLDVVSTEYHRRFRRRAVWERLQALRRIPRALHIEGTNICNAKCVFCAYPQMERPKQTMPMDEFRRIVDEYVAMGGRHVSLTPIVGDPFVDPHFLSRLDDLCARPQLSGLSGSGARSWKPTRAAAISLLRKTWWRYRFRIACQEELRALGEAAGKTGLCQAGSPRGG